MTRPRIAGHRVFHSMERLFERGNVLYPGQLTDLKADAVAIRMFRCMERALAARSRECQGRAEETESQRLR
ncbi:hypothetical protein SAMN05444920_106442 [Nonomuraea solani]|uniref:Uncharacterized protein n=1 Tax=Nonomuraea solani TaxID=1144553 RepID=A0A1H6DVS4_9ACTN|nr:hypothetical protein SAMN05444920_106442 [Nonomuraea solani]